MKLSEGFAILENKSIPLTPYAKVSSIEDAKKFVSKEGYPVVLKLDSTLHKTEFKGVKINLFNEEMLIKALEDLGEIAFKNNIASEFIIQKQIDGVEVIIGLKKDPIFGKVVLLGSGGILTEILKDISFRVVPVTKKDIKQMVEEISANKLLEGYRGSKAVNLNKLVDIILKIQKLNYSEIDLNPVILNEKGAFVVDVRLIS